MHNMAPRLNPVRKASVQSSFHSTVWIAPRRLVLILPVLAVCYTVYHTSPHPVDPVEGNFKGQGAPETGYSSESVADIDASLEKKRQDDSNDAQIDPTFVVDGALKPNPRAVDRNGVDYDYIDGNGASESNDVVSEMRELDGDAEKDVGGDNATPHRVAGLSCDSYGGPQAEVAREMIYWRDIPIDADFQFPLKHESEEQFLTFEPDEGGWLVMLSSVQLYVLDRQRDLSG